MMSTALKLDNVTVTRGAKTLVKDVEWEVFGGEHWVILGPNGAGKTTLMRLAAAQIFPSLGSVQVLGNQLGKVDLAQLKPLIGMCSSALAARIRGADRVLDVVMSAAYGMLGRWREVYEGVDEARAQTLLNVFGIGTLADRRWATLSSGERKRVEICRALMADPEILLLDEPSSGLDLGGREEVIGALTELANDKRSPTMVLVTHHVEEIPPGFSHLMLLRDSRVIASGPIEQCLTGENLSAAFGLPLQVEKTGGRWRAQSAVVENTAGADASGEGTRRARRGAN